MTAGRERGERDTHTSLRGAADVGLAGAEVGRGGGGAEVTHRPVLTERF